VTINRVGMDSSKICEEFCEYGWNHTNVYIGFSKEVGN